MDTSCKFLTIFTALFALFNPTALQAAGELGSKDFPKHFHWQGKAKGDIVTMDIDAAPFVAAEHKTRRDGWVVDGYQAQPGYQPGTWAFFTIKNWTIHWGHRRLRPFPQGVYTSVFTPHLPGPEAGPDYQNDAVCICDGGDALMVTMGFGADGVSGTVVFVITKDGRVRRFITHVFS